MSAQRRVPRRAFTLLLTVLVLAVLGVAWWQVDALFRARLLDDERARLSERLALYANSLSRAVARRFGLLEGLAAFARLHPGAVVPEADFNAFAAGLVASAPGIRAVQVAPGGVVRRVYPLAGNMVTVGHDLLADDRPGVRDDIGRALETRRITVSGPYELLQGGVGLLGRFALFDTDRFTGFVTIVLDMDVLLAAARIGADLSDLRVAIRGADGGTIDGEAATFGPDAVLASVELPEGAWEMAALPARGWGAAGRGQLAVFRSVSLLALAAIAVAALLVLERGRTLGRLVRERTDELVRSVASLDALFKEAPLGLGLLDASLRYQRVNGTYASLDGVPVEGHAGRPVDELPPALPGLPALQREVLATGKPAIDVALSDGGRHWLASCFPVGGPGPGPAGVGTVFVEVTHLRRAEEEIRRLNAGLEARVAERTDALAVTARRLERANKELKTFSYSVSHDLKAPLRGIDGYSKLLLETYGNSLDEDGRHFLRTLRASARQMATLIEDLLAYSRLEHRSLVLATVDPGALVQALLAERAAEIADRGIVVDVDVRCAAVLVESEGLAQTLRNLLDNALKFTRGVERPRIEVGGRPSGDGCTLWVRDNGIGFDMKYRDRIFEIFQRLHRVEDYPGTGVGLAIVAKAVERMGGRVDVASSPGAGATFTLEIPGTAREMEPS